MKEIVLLIDGQTVGPFPAENVEARFASGEFPADTPCAEPGADAWSTLGEMFPAKKPIGVRVARKTREEEAEMKAATSEKLDPDVRKKLLLYNLADAITVDKFTPAQADAAIRIHEDALKKGKKLKIAVCAGGFVLSVAVASLIFNCVNVGVADGGRKLKFFEWLCQTPPNPELKKTAKNIMAEKKRLDEAREEAAAVKFFAPRGQGSPRQQFLGAVEIKNPDVSTITGTLDYSAFAETLPDALKESATYEIVHVQRVDDRTEKLIAEQDRLFSILRSPLWTDAELREAIERELLADYPADAGIPESADILRQIKTFSLKSVEGQLAFLSERVAKIAQDKEIQSRIQERVKTRFKNKKNTGSTREKENAGGHADRVADRQTSSKSALEWARAKMPKFLMKLTDFLAEKEIYYSAEARNEAWRGFAENELPKIQEAVRKTEIERAPLAENGSFVFSGRNARSFVFVAQLDRAGDIYFVPASDSSAGTSDSVKLSDIVVNRKTLQPEDVLMDERYAVSAKEKTGGVPVAMSRKLGGREIYIVRTTPEWFYISVEKVRAEGEDASRRRTPVLLRVPADFYESVSVGDEIPMEKLLTFERFGRPASTSVTGSLQPIPDDKLEEVKESQRAAGIPFPPPPEQASAPEAPRKKSAEPASGESAEAVPAAAESGENAENDVPAGTAEESVPADDASPEGDDE